MDEIWKDIPGYEGRYQISNHGNIVGFRYKNNTLNKPRIMKPFVTPDGYLRIGLSDAIKQKKFFVHRLVMIAFKATKNKSLQINHVNGIKSDNRVSNLEWITLSDNHKHAYRVLGRKDKWKICDGYSKLNKKDVYRIRLEIFKNKTITFISKKFSISKSTVRDIRDGRTWKNI